MYKNSVIDFNAMIKDPANIYPYLPDISSQDLVHFFRFAIVNTCSYAAKEQDFYIENALRTFFLAGLSPKLIDKNVQSAILGRDKTRKVSYDSAERIAEMFIQNNIKISDEALMIFVDVLKYSPVLTKISLPNSVISHAICTQGPEELAELLKNINIKDLPANILARLLGNLCPMYKKMAYNNFKESYEDIIFSVIETLSARLATMDKLAQKSIYDIIVTDKSVLEYITGAYYKHNPNVFSRLSHDLRIEAIKTYPNYDLLQIIGARNTTLELAYCTTVNPVANDLQSSITDNFTGPTKQYLNIINAIKTNSSCSFANLPAEVINALIDTKFDKITWYKTMEKMLVSNPNLATEYVDKMMTTEPNVKPLLERNWRAFQNSQWATKNQVEQAVKKVDLFKQKVRELFTRPEH